MVNTPFQSKSQQLSSAIQSPPKYSNEDNSLTKPLPPSTSQSITQQQQLPQRKQIRSLKKQFTKPNLSTPVIPSSQLITPNLSKVNNTSDSTNTETSITSINNNKSINNDNNNNEKNSTNKDKPFSSITFASTTNIISNSDSKSNKKDQKGSTYNNNNNITIQQHNINNKNEPIMLLEKGKHGTNSKQTVNLNNTHFINYNNQNLQFESKVQPTKKPLKKNWGKQKEHQALNINLDHQDININATNLFSQPSANEKPKKAKRGRPPTSKTTDKSIDDNDIDDSIKPKKMSKKSSKTGNNTNTLYCICQTPYDAPSFMIACDRCDQWFHGECINISEKEGEFIDLYFCSNCSKETGKSTSWKPKCINPTCNKAARISTNQGYKSKYCSHECGMEVARSQLESADKKRDTTIATTNDKDIYELIISKRKKCRLLSYAHKEDHESLEKLKIEKNQYQKIVKLIDLKLILLKLTIKQVQSLDICGFDSRLIWDDIYWKEITDVTTTTTNDKNDIILHYIPNSELINKSYHQCKLKKKECHRHHQWQKILTAEMEQERKEQLNRLISLDKEKRNIKTRIHQRSDNNNLVNIISNHTTIH